VGGESTRPGAQRVGADEELRRIGPVVTTLATAGVPVSVDTMRARVAAYAIEQGAVLVNDVSGGLADPDMVHVAADAGVAYVVMHWRGHSTDMYARASYQDVVLEVRDELQQRVADATKAGVDPDRIVLDPGLGFGKRPKHNWPLLANLRVVASLDGREFPVLVGASRKSFIGKLLAAPDGTPRSFEGSDDATVATTALAAANGAWCVRVHSVPGNADAVRVAAAIYPRPVPALGSVPAPGSVPADAVLAIGGNLGDRRGTLRAAVAEIARLPGTSISAVSPVYQTAPVGGPEQPDYLNAVLLIQTTLPPRDLLAGLLAIEAAHGRVRDVRFGPRTLDIDLISYAGQVSDDPVLTLPHPRAHERAFVLAPWHDIDPDATLGGRSVSDLLDAAESQQIRKLPGPLLP
jgi:dihydropteroate synthase